MKEEAPSGNRWRRSAPRFPPPRVRLDTFRRLVEATRRIGGPPADFLEFRRHQLDLILTHARVPFDGTVLELGGGVSGQAFLLTDFAEHVICTDLLEVGSSYGGKFVEAAALATVDPDRRLKYVCARGESIPLRNAAVDTVFCSYVFEHIADRPAAVGEIWRVLKPGGHAVINVPNRMEPIHRALGFYFGDVPRQVLKSALEWSGLRKRFRIPIRVLPPPRPRNAEELRRWLRATFTYRPHGAYRDHLEELRESGIGRWDRLFRQRGFVIERRFTVSLENYLAFPSPEFTRAAQRLLMPLLYRFADAPVVVWIGDSYCFVARKPLS